MRQKLNENPMLQIAIIGVLAAGVGLLLITRMGGGSSAPAPTTSTAATAPTAGAVPPAASTVPAPSAGAADATAPPTATPTPAPADAATAAPASPAAPPATGSVSAGEFTAGPGLPKPVVTAYDANKAIVLLVVRKQGIDDQAVRAGVETLRARSDVAVFVTGAGEISRYSRITEGVDVNQVPALVVVQPKDLSKTDQPTASVSYGFRGAGSIVQAVDDALYKGKQLPYYPQ